MKQFGDGGYLHLFHHMRLILFHRALRSPELVSNLSVQCAGNNLCESLPLARGQGFVPRTQAEQLVRSQASFGLSRYRASHSIKQRLALDWLPDENNWQWLVEFDECTLEVESMRRADAKNHAALRVFRFV